MCAVSYTHLDVYKRQILDEYTQRYKMGRKQFLIVYSADDGELVSDEEENLQGLKFLPSIVHNVLL